MQRHSIAFTTGTILILTITLCFVFAAVFYMIGCGINATVLPISCIVATMFVSRSNTWSRICLSALVAVLVWALCAYICTVLYDSSCDGNWYHMEIVANLFNGWNPYRNPSGIVSYELWAEHYSKAMEMVGACLMMITQRIQSSKAVMPVLAIGLLLILPTFIRQITPQISRKQSVLLSLLVVSNPVLVCQMLRFYIDDVVYICVVLAIVSSVLIAINDRRALLPYTFMAASIILAAGTKANALVYVVFVIICALVGRLIYGKKQRIMEYALFCIIVGLIAVFGICYHPYVTNWLNNGHPLFPLMGEGAVDIMTGNTPEELLRNNRFVNFFISVFSFSRPSVDTRSGGFTPTFVLLFPLALVLLSYYCVKGRRSMSPFVYVGICVLISCFIFEQSWWARYVPQLWLLVPLTAYVLMLNSVGRAMKCVRSIFVVLGIITGAVCCMTTYLGTLRYTLRTKNTFKVLDGRSLPIFAGEPQTVRMLEENGFTVVEYPWTDITDVRKDSVMFDSVMYEAMVGHTEWNKVLTAPEDARLDSLLRSNKFYKYGVAVRRFIGKDDDIPFYNSDPVVD